jgi:hypothetical protein
MNKLKSKVFLTLLFSGIVGLFSNCTKHNQVLDLQSTTPPAGASTTLTTVKGSPKVLGYGEGTWDGTIESIWNNAPKLSVTATVPDMGNNTFTGFVGNSTSVTMRSCYDANNVYYLIEWNSPQKHAQSAQWYYNPTTRLWAQESGAPSLNADGTYRPPFIQDQFTMIYNIANNPSMSFSTLSCYAACHANMAYNGGTAPAGGVMYTNGPNEVLDCWRARVLQVVNANQANDCFIDDGASVGLGASGTLNKNEVHSDWQTHNGSATSVPPALQSTQAADGGFSNKISLTVTGKKNKVSVPWYVIPAGNYSNSAILLSDTGTKAIRVVAVDTNGVLTLANGSMIDPRTTASGTDYQQVGSGDGAKCIPGSVVGQYTASRGDVAANAFYTGSGWRLLMKRALRTTDLKYDVDFMPLMDQSFGIGVMFNGADNQHAITTGLTQTFQK